MRTFKKLHIWQKAIVLVDGIYALTKTFPKEDPLELITGIQKMNYKPQAKLNK